MWLNLTQQDVDKAVAARDKAVKTKVSFSDFHLTVSCPVFQCINRYYPKGKISVGCDSVLFKGDRTYVFGKTARRITEMNSADWSTIIPGRIFVKGLEKEPMTKRVKSAMAYKP